MIPNNVFSLVSSVRKMVATTEEGQPPSGAIGRLRQTLQQAQETVSSRLQRPPAQAAPLPTPEINIVQKEVTPTAVEIGRCRVCMKSIKEDEFFRECGECSLKVCEDCGSYATAEPSQSWRCSVCRRKGIAIIARRVKIGIAESDALEGGGFSTSFRKSPDARRLKDSGRADSETEVLLLAPKASDVRRHSDVPLRDIKKFNELNAAASASDISKKAEEEPPPPPITIKKEEEKKPSKVKRQRSLGERGQSEGNLNVPANRARRSSCDIRQPIILSENAIAESNEESKKPNKPKPVEHVSRQGSSTDGEAIKIVIDDVDSSSKEPSQPERTKTVRLRRDPQDRGYQTRGFGLRVVGGCSANDKAPGKLRARVARVTAGSSADFAGIRRGDTVISWNGVRLSNLTFEEVTRVLDAPADSVEITISPYDAESTSESEYEGETEEVTSPTRRRLPRLPGEGRIQLRLFHDEVHNTLEVGIANVSFGLDDANTLDLSDLIVSLRMGDKCGATRVGGSAVLTGLSSEDLFDSWLVIELARANEFIGEAHVDTGRVSLDDRAVWVPFSSKGSSTHRGSISLFSSPNTPPSAVDLARRLRMHRIANSSQSQSEFFSGSQEDAEDFDSSGQSSPCQSLLRPEVAWEVLGTLGPPSSQLTCRSAPTSRRGSAQFEIQSDRPGVLEEEGRGSAPSTPAMPRSLPPSRRGSFAVAVEEVINRSRRCSVAPGFPRQLPSLPGDAEAALARGRRASAFVGHSDFSRGPPPLERSDSLRQMRSHEWMRESWVAVGVPLCAAYVFLIFVGKRLMANRKGFELKTPLFLWNFFLAAFSILGCFRTVPEVLFILNRPNGFHYTVCLPSSEHNEVWAFWAYAFVMSKAFELGDTAFVVLRKRPLLFLHYYHHVTVLLYSWFSYSEYIAPARWYILLNFVVHSVMYSYFAVRALGWRVPRAISACVTGIQISQFLVGLAVNLHALQAKANGTQCDVSDRNVSVSLLMYGSYVLLFTRFFTSTYLRNSSAKQKSQ